MRISRPTLIILCMLMFSSLLRIPLLGTMPPGGIQSMWLRLPSALAGIISVVLFAWIVKKTTQEASCGLWAGFMLALTPWHIEQSRVISQAMIGLTIILAGISCFLKWTNPAIRICTAFATFILVYLSYPSLWLFSASLAYVQPENILDNAGKLLSGKFFFFKNDTFWAGGTRSGVFDPSLIPLAILGVYELMKRIRMCHWIWLAGFILILTIAAANPRFPEGREYFLALPFAVYIVSLGARRLYRIHAASTLTVRTFIYCLAGFVVYGYIQFFHMYTVHYPQRIVKEIPYERRDF